MFHWLTERRRRHILEHPFPPEWERVLERNVAAYGLLTEDERLRLRQLAQVLIAEKNWEGCGGLELTDEIRVTIAGQACLLLLGRDHDLFARLVSILVYPSTILTPEAQLPMFGFTRQPLRGRVPILGEAYRDDVVILVWDAVQRGARDPHDGHNVVIHELAHIIDFLDGAADGTPPLESREQSREWGRVCGDAFTALKQASERGTRSFLDAYGATNEAEFFAVATEAFFERAPDLARQLPDLYHVLSRFYNLDPAARERQPS